MVVDFLVLEVPYLQTAAIVGNVLGKVPRTAPTELLPDLPQTGLKAVENAEAGPPRVAFGAGFSLMKQPAAW